MTTITVYGADDDVIAVEGDDIAEEFYLQDAELGDLLAFSDGTVLQCVFSEARTWRIDVIAKGAAELEVNATAADDEDYTDRVTLRGGDIQWVEHGGDRVYVDGGR